MTLELTKFEVTHSDGTRAVVKATNEAMARQFAMEKKWGPASQNRAFPVGQWMGKGLSVKIASKEDEQFTKMMELKDA